MTKSELIQQTKATALNAIRKICHPNYNGIHGNYWDDTPAEQRDYKIRSIIDQLEKDLTAIRHKYKIRIGDTVMVCQTKDNYKNNDFNVKMQVVNEALNLYAVRCFDWPEGQTVGMPKKYCKKFGL